MAFIKPTKPVAQPVPKPVPEPPKVVPQASIPSDELAAMADTFHRMSDEGRVSLILPYLVGLTPALALDLVEGLRGAARAECAGFLLGECKPEEQADVILERVAEHAGNDKVTRKAAERIAEAFAMYRDDAKVEAEHEEWFSEISEEKLVEAADRDRTEPMDPETTAGLLNSVDYLTRDRWFSAFINWLDSKSREDLGAYWHGDTGHRGAPH